MKNVCYGSCFSFGEDKLKREQFLSEPVLKTPQNTLSSVWTDLHVYRGFSCEESDFRQCIITQNSGLQRDIIVTELHKLAIKMHLNNKTCPCLSAFKYYGCKCEALEILGTNLF